MDYLEAEWRGGREVIRHGGLAPVHAEGPTGKIGPPGRLMPGSPSQAASTEAIAKGCAYMTTRTGIVLLLIGLPAVAAAEGIDMAQCTEVASRFSSNPQGLRIGELDVLKTCINVQVMAMAEEASQRSRTPSQRSLATAQPPDGL